MRSLSIFIALSSIILATRTVEAQMVEVPLRDLTSLARITFTTTGECRERLGPDGHSLYVTCPSVEEGLEQSLRELLRESPVYSRVYRTRNSTTIELALETPLSGYHLNQERHRVTLDIGPRAVRTVYKQLEEEVRWPLATAKTPEALESVDDLFAENHLSAAHEVLDKAPREARDEMYHLRNADLIRLEGNYKRASQAYRSVAGRFRHRPCGHLAQVYHAQLAFLDPSATRKARVPEFSSLGQSPSPATQMAWLGAARLYSWKGEHRSAIRIAQKLNRQTLDAKIVSRAGRIVDREIASLVLCASRAGEHQKVADLAIEFHDELLGHPGGELLAPRIHESLMKHGLPEQAAAILQAVVGRSDDDELVLEWADEMAAAYLEAGSIYRASQVVEYAIAISRGREDHHDELRQIQSRVALIEKRPRRALEALSKVSRPDLRLQLDLAQALLRTGATAESLRQLDAVNARRSELPQLLRDQLDEARLEAQLILGDEQAGVGVDELILRSEKSARLARLAYLRGRQLAEKGDLARAESVFEAVEGDRLWKRLGQIAASEADLAQSLNAASAAESPSVTSDEDDEPTPSKRPRRRRARRDAASNDDGEGPASTNEDEPTPAPSAAEEPAAEPAAEPAEPRLEPTAAPASGSEE